MPRVETIIGLPDDPTAEDPTKPQDDGKRDRSTIQFPYLPLDEAVTIAKGVHEVGGNHCQLDQLAAHLQQKADASAFRLKLGTSKMFGLVTYGQGTVTLTSLGTSICDPDQEQSARAKAFLTIPLYKRIYDEFKGGNLPPMSGLETAIANMGVAPKQKSNARQVFQRSATQAGFFAYGQSRLVYPPIKGSAAAAPAVDQHSIINEPEKEIEKPERKKSTNDGGDGGSGHHHPFIQGLIKTLPPTDGSWPIEKRAQWLQAAVSVFNLIYTDDISSGRIDIKIQKESA